MSQQDNFFSGFVVGTLFGGIVGGLAGAVVASRMADKEKALEGESSEGARSLDLSSEKGMEVARRSLEDKIAKLNEAIDDVQQQLGGVNGTVSSDNGEQAIAND